LAFLPYKGIELSAIAIVILVITILKTTKNMYVCNVSLSKPKLVKSKDLNKKNKIN